jgi:LysM repeat protein
MAFALIFTLALSFIPVSAFAASAESGTVSLAGNGVEHGGYGYTCSSYYWVVKGDNLSTIAKWYGVSTRALAAANGISNPSLIYPGQRLCIPSGHSVDGGYYGGGHHDGGYHAGCHQCGGCYYTVQSGDNLSEIASWYHTTVHHLARVNHISNPRVIIPGQVLYVCH